MIKFRIFAALWLLFAAGTAQAHLLPKQNATMKIVDNSANFVVSVPVSALVGVDEDGNGTLSAQEIDRHNEIIKIQFANRFKVSSEGKTGSTRLTWVMPPDINGMEPETDYLVIMHSTEFASVPENPSLSTDLFGSKDGEGQITIKATHGETVEVAIFRPGASSHQFFLGAWATFADYVRIGVEHILGGVDHLLFLLTIVIAGAGWRYWLGVITSFIIAHSITLGLSTLGIFSISAAIVEPAIAASIVIIAVLNLVYRGRDDARIGWTRIALVFACGLIHGFGFASAIGAMVQDTGGLIAMLAGFNIGIEIGQFLFLGAVLLLIMLFRKFGQERVARWIPQSASIAAAVFGSVIFIQRVV
tara:strand:+ start:950 stop:2029 length:1080 start_codon:yes stop_codon:yes gene_type:complete